MSIDPLKRFLDQLPSPERWLSDNRLRGYLLLLLLAGLVFQLLYPVVLYDSDMWYHLDGGRYFWTQGEIPNHAFFSFITPERTFTNYYWGFQALIYKVYEWGDYQGLLILRSLLVALTVYLVYRFLLLQHRDGTPMLPLVLLFILYFTLIEGRLPNLRPHLFSQLFMISFLLILEKRRAYSPLLPLLTVFWANLHGIEYPVPVLIGGAYFIEICWNGYRNGTIEREDKICLASLLSCIPALLATPHGIDLLATPFTVAEHVNRYIGEMRPLDLRLFYTLGVSGRYLSNEVAFTFVFLLSLLVIGRLIHQRRFSISHVVLTIGAFLLLSRGTRFIWEWAFLMLPILARGISLSGLARLQLQSITRVVMIAFVLSLPLTTLASRLPKDFSYPLAVESLPLGTVSTIASIADSGKVVTPLTSAGYVHWALGNHFKVLADLQMSLFTDFDIYRAQTFYSNKQSMKRTLDKEQPEFILVPLKSVAAGTMLKEDGRYEPVMFDDKAVLYSARKPLPIRALQYIDPFAIETEPDAEDADESAEELKRLLSERPESNRALHALTRLLFNQKRYDEALPWAERFAARYPTDPNSEYLLGNVLENKNQCSEAISHYQNALKHADRLFSTTIQARMGSCFYMTKDFDSAYKYLWRGLNPFSKSTASEDLYQLAFSAFVIGKQKEATTLLEILLYGSTAKEGSPIWKNAQNLLQDISKEPEEQMGFFSWLWSKLALQNPGAK